MQRFRPICVVLTLWLIVGCVSRPAQDSGAAGHQAPKYVFLFIGDGMGIAQTHAAEIYQHAIKPAADAKPSPGIEKLRLSELPVTGLIATYSANSQITDSAAAGTALATGHKTANGIDSMNPDGTLRYDSLADAARAHGLKVGIVSSSAITDATPAVFYAHQSRRSDQYAIGLQLAASRFEYFAGDEIGKDADGPQGNVLDLARRNGFELARTREELAACRPAQRVLFQGKMPYVIDRPKTGVTLAELTAKGIELLNSSDGFFMMVEGGSIDGAGHENDAATSVHEVLDFDAAVAEALRFYRQHPLETLIVITGDHETGGMGLNFDGRKSPRAMACLAAQKQSWTAFNREVFLPFARSQAWQSTADNLPGDLWQTIHDMFGLAYDELSADQKVALEDAYDASMATRGKLDEQGRRPSLPGYGRYEPLPLTAARLVGQRAGIGWTTTGHTCLPLPVWAIGPGAYRFDGFYDNTDIAKKLAESLGIKLPPPVPALTTAPAAASQPDYTNRTDLPPAKSK